MSRRGDLVPVALLAILAGFVGVQVAGARTHRPPSPPPVGDMWSAASSSLDEGGARDTALERLARDRLASDSPGTYIHELLVADSVLRRWHNGPGTPLLVWVQPSAALQGWSAELPAAVREAFALWERELPIAFAFTADSAAADVRVSWVSRLAGVEQIGNSSRSYDPRGRILRAEIVLAMLGRDGRPLSPRTSRIAALHEVGHILGLEHSPDPRDVMVALYDGRATGLSAADVATARLLYALPSGRMRMGE